MSLRRTFTILILTALLFFSYPYFPYSDKGNASNELLNSWISSPKILPNQIASHNSVFLNNKLFIFGGANNDDFNQVFSAGSNSDGSLDDWLSVNNLPETRYWASRAVSGNRIYLLGGAKFDGSTTYAKTVYSALGNNGSLSNWQILTAMPSAAAQGGAVVVGNYLYYMGGRNDTGNRQDIFYAPINTNGTLGAWVTSAISLPAPMFAMGIGAYQNNIYVVGGVANGVVVKKVYKTVVNPANGALSAFIEVDALPHDYNGTNQTLIVDNKIITVGGGDNNGPIKNVFYTDINPDGTLSGWQESAYPLPVANGGGAVGFGNGYLYFTGGYSGGYTDKVYYTKLNLDTILNVPVLKQTDSAWGSQLYDSANLWASLGHQGLTQWGCALTSAAMVFNYHGITKLPDGTALNPGTLNTWLKTQKDGYVDAGLVNWLALSRLSKLAKAKNPNFAYDALEYIRTGFNATQLTADLKNNIPDILEQPGHFIVAKATNGNTFGINDPFYARTLLSEYGNSAISMGKFTPSNTDLSYIMLTAPEGINITVSQGLGNHVGTAFTQQPLDEDGGTLKSGKPINFYYVEKPGNGSYSVRLSGNTTSQYSLQSYIYNKDGNVTATTHKGILGSTSSDTLTISGLTIKPDYTFDTLIADLDLLYAQKKITSLAVYSALKIKAQQAKAAAGDKKALAKSFLQSFIIELDTNKKRTVLEDAWQILSPEVLFLKNSL